jgi:hypothetical protein
MVKYGRVKPSANRFTGFGFPLADGDRGNALQVMARVTPPANPPYALPRSTWEHVARGPQSIFLDMAAGTNRANAHWAWVQRNRSGVPRCPGKIFISLKPPSSARGRPPKPTPQPGRILRVSHGLICDWPNSRTATASSIFFTRRRRQRIATNADEWSARPKAQGPRWKTRTALLPIVR